MEQPESGQCEIKQKDVGNQMRKNIVVSTGMVAADLGRNKQEEKDVSQAKIEHLAMDQIQAVEEKKRFFKKGHTKATEQMKALYTEIENSRDEENLGRWHHVSTIGYSEWNTHK